MTPSLWHRGTRRWSALLVGVALAIAGCGVPADDEARRTPSGQVPEEFFRPSTTLPPTTTTVATRFDVTLYYVDADDRLVPVDRTLEAAPSLEDLVAVLLEPPPASDVDGPLRTALAGTDEPVVNAVSLERGVASVDLSVAFRSLPPSDQLLGIAQIVYTATGRSGVGRADFTLDGEPVDVPSGDGSLTSDPVARDDYTNLLAG